MRLSEAAGLSKDDIHLNEEVPHLDIKPHSWRRPKTAGSQRKIPLLICLCGQRGGRMRPVTATYCFQDVVMIKSVILTLLVLP